MTKEQEQSDDLNFTAAFDAVTEHLIRAVQVDDAEGIPDNARVRLRAVLLDMDRVFGVLGCG